LASAVDPADQSRAQLEASRLAHQIDRRLPSLDLPATAEISDKAGHSRYSDHAERRIGSGPRPLPVQKWNVATAKLSSVCHRKEW
jgi:hypothetical protein